jgi:isoamylase
MTTAASPPAVSPQAPSATPGSSHPLGATIEAGGVNLSLYGKRATGVELLLFDHHDDDRPTQTVVFDRHANRTGSYWHAFVPGIRAGQVYGYRVQGPFAPEHGDRFDDRRLLLDPYGRGVVVPPGYRRQTGDPIDGDVGRAMKSVVVDVSDYDWEGDRPLDRPFAETVIYEAHVRGFTAHPNSRVTPELRGTYAGFIERIPYLVDLGVTAVELLPIFQFDALDAPAGLPNYWGYQPVSFFAPHGQYSSRDGAEAAVDEFRDLVKALHRAGLEVILDVVFNHTSEGGADGPTFGYRGLANRDYYLLDPDDRSRYADYSGTGNTLNANASIVRRLILDSLRYWVAEMHVDGFRFDLASVLSRDEDGRPLPRPPILWDIENDPILAGTKLIAEAWDAAGLYQVGSFAGDRWVEWNGRFRDDVRSFAKSDPGKAWLVAERILGSPDIYAHLGREPQKTVNFVTCHDGFTLNDVVSYDTKHNDANGESNRDGNDQNLSWNSGVEGPTDDPDVERLRRRQIKNLLVIELLAVGVPMLTMGDEVRRTQLGNNNAYCQDSELSWFDWSLLARHADIRRFTQRLIAGRRTAREMFDVPDDVSLTELLRDTRVDRHGVRLGQPDTSDASRTVALTLWGRSLVIHLILNAFWEPLDFEIPPTGSGAEGWRRVIDTSVEGPDDFAPFQDAPPVGGATYAAGARSVVVLASRRVADDADDADDADGRVDA